MSARLRAIAQETVNIAEQGYYDGPAGRVDIAAEVAQSVAGTRLYLPDDDLPEPPEAGGVVGGGGPGAPGLRGGVAGGGTAAPGLRGGVGGGPAAPGSGDVVGGGGAGGPASGDGSEPHEGRDLRGRDLSGGAAGWRPRIEVTPESTLWAARRIGGNPAVLNFASARNPGGGFRNGAQAQEESLARASAMYPCLLKAGDFYAYHRADPSLLYTDRIIYAPSVPVFRDDKGRLLDEPYPVSFLVSAAPNRSAIARNQPGALPAIRDALARRAARVLRVAAAHGHRELVLGAWGCGVFGNDPAEVAEVFAEALASGPRFDRVVFAILDRGGNTRKAFEDALG